jgi:hypothetical protein
LNLKCDILVSKFAFKSNLYHYKAAQKAGMPVGGKLPPLTEDGAPAKPLFGLRKMLAAQKNPTKAGGCTS